MSRTSKEATPFKVANLFYCSEPKALRASKMLVSGIFAARPTLQWGRPGRWEDSKLCQFIVSSCVTTDINRLQQTCILWLKLSKHFPPPHWPQFFGHPRLQHQTWDSSGISERTSLASLSMFNPSINLRGNAAAKRTTKNKYDKNSLQTLYVWSCKSL